MGRNPVVHGFPRHHEQAVLELPTRGKMLGFQLTGGGLIP